jgi:regulator of replication initiation timing
LHKKQRKIDDLENRLKQAVVDNTLLRKLNDIFGDENDKLTRENKTLKTELEQGNQLKAPLIRTKSTKQASDSAKRPSKRTVTERSEKSYDKSRESKAIEARVRIFLLGKIANEF